MLNQAIRSTTNGSQQKKWERNEPLKHIFADNPPNLSKVQENF
jgi:hypothetical protein